jgi:tripartite-type tricarboxylate transporter receptor subunit TctC
MKNPSRRAMIIAGAAGVLPVWNTYAADYPSQPIKLIVPFSTGGSSDAIARMLAQELSNRLGKPVVIENRPGAGTIIGTSEVSRANSDGHTLLLMAAPFAIAPAIYKSLPYAPESLRGVALVSTAALVLTATASLPADDVDGLVAMAKKDPNAVSYASPGNGSLPHLVGELFKQRNKISMTHVAYKGAGPAVVDLMGGHVQVMFASPIEVAPSVASGRLKYLRDATGKVAGSDAMASTLPSDNVPAAGAWFGIAAPRKTPDAVVARLSDELGKILALSEIRKQFESQGANVAFKGYADFDRFISGERERWMTVVKTANIVVE